MPSAKRFPVKTIIALIATFFLSGGIAYATVPASGGALISPKNEETSEAVKSTGFGQFANEPKTEEREKKKSEVICVARRAKHFRLKRNG